MFDIDPHTADIRIRLRAASPEELVADAVRALMAVMKPGAGPAAPDVEIFLEAPDLTALLVDFLNEILLRCHIDRQAFEPESIVLSGTAVTARLFARAAVHFQEDVKAVTYHEADVVQSEGVWTTTLVLDV
jgi:SHS2 domain-containing protein